MTDNERVLHTVLSTVTRPIPEALGDKIGVLQARVAYLENRLEEIETVVGDQVQENALKNMHSSKNESSYDVNEKLGIKNY